MSVLAFNEGEPLLLQGTVITDWIMQLGKGELQVCCYILVCDSFIQLG